MIEQALLFFTQGEWYAMLGALLLGIGVTEALKRLARAHLAWAAPMWFYPAAGFVATLVCAFAIWPRDGKFAHPFVAAAITALFAPTIYKIITTALRRVGFGWVADVISGAQREQRRPAKGAGRRHE